MSKRKDFQLKMPGLTVSLEIYPEVLESKANINELKSSMRASIEQWFENWLNTEFEPFFEKEIQENKERWAKEEYSFSDRLLNKIP